MPVSITLIEVEGYCGGKVKLKVVILDTFLFKFCVVLEIIMNIMLCKRTHINDAYPALTKTFVLASSAAT